MFAGTVTLAIDVTQGTEWELFVSFEYLCVCVCLNSCSPCHVPELVYGTRNIIICVQAFNVIITHLISSGAISVATIL